MCDPYVNVASVESPVDVDPCRRGSPWRTLRAQGPPWVMRAPRVCGSHMCDPYGRMRIRRRFCLTLPYVVGARHGAPSGHRARRESCGRRGFAGRTCATPTARKVIYVSKEVDVPYCKPYCKPVGAGTQGETSCGAGTHIWIEEHYPRNRRYPRNCPGNYPRNRRYPRNCPGNYPRNRRYPRNCPGNYPRNRRYPRNCPRKNPRFTSR